MRTLRQAVGVLLSICSLAAIGVSFAWAGARPPIFVDDQILREKYHIEPNRDGFLVALKHSDGSVRAYGATRLAQTHDNRALPYIVQAMKNESSVGVRFILALRAGELGGEEGVSELQSACQTSDNSTLRVLAADYLLRLGHEECLPVVLDALTVPDDIQSSFMALDLLPQFHPTTAKDIEDIKTAFVKALASDNMAVRTHAGGTIRRVGTQWAAEQLQRALAVETDDTARASFEDDLKFIQEKTRDAVKQ